MTYQTTRFGSLSVAEEDILQFPEGMLGFDDLHRYFVVDPGDDTLILWLQSCDSPQVAFPIIEPSIVKDEYKVALTKIELGILKMGAVTEGKIFLILTIPEDITQMTANLKAPIVLNIKERLGRQCVLQQNDYTVKFSVFQTLKARISMMKRPQGTMVGTSSSQSRQDSPAVVGQDKLREPSLSP